MLMIGAPAPPKKTDKEDGAEATEEKKEEGAEATAAVDHPNQQFYFEDDVLT